MPTPAGMFDWVVSVVRTLGYPGLALLTLLENVAPPIPSEIIMPLAGFLSERGDMAYSLAVAAGTLGALAGALGWYWMGRRVGEKRVRAFFNRHGRWFAVNDEEIDRAARWFKRHGNAAVLIGRLIPAVRTFISLPAGFAGMHWLPFTAYTFVGTVLWTAALTHAGVLLGRNYDAVQDYLSPVTWAILAGIVGWYLYKVATYEERSAGSGRDVRGET